MNRKTKYSIFLMVLFIFTVFAGCDDQSNNEQDDTANIIMNQKQQAILTFYFPYYQNTGEKPDAKQVLSEIEKQTEGILNIKLNFNWVHVTKYADAIREKLASGDSIDALFCGTPDPSLLNFVEMARNGELADLTDVFPKMAPDLYQKYSSDDLECASVDGKLVAVPSLYPLANGVYAIVREDLMKKYNVPEIKSYEDYDLYLKTIKENEKNIIPGKITDTTFDLFSRSNDYASFTDFFVYKWDGPTMKIIPWEQTSGFRKAVDLLMRWNKNEYLDSLKQNQGDMWTVTSKLLTTNKISSVIFSGEYRTGETIDTIVYNLNRSLNQNDVDGEIKAYRLYPEYKAQRLNPMGDGLINGSIALCAKSKNVERILMFLDWIQRSQSNYDLLMYGLNGKHYNLNGEQIYYPEGMTIDKNPYLGWSGRSAFKNISYDRFY